MTRDDGATGADLQVGDDGVAVLSGVLDFASVTALHARTNALFAAGEAVVINAAGVEKANSAGVALLLEWLAVAHARGCSLQFRDLPETILAVARLSDVDDLLAGDGFTARRNAREAYRLYML